MSERLDIELTVGREGRASAWRHYLPAGSKATDCLLEPVTIVVKAPIYEGLPPECSGESVRVYVGEKRTWQNTEEALRTFGALWAEILQVVTDLTDDSVMLIFLSGLATHTDLFSLWSYLPFGFDDEVRFYVSEVCKESRDASAARVWLCLEYAREGFRRFAEATGREYSYGTTAMGMSVGEAAVNKYLRTDPLDKNALEQLLRSPDLRCWWVCDADFTGMTIWHKDYAGGELAGHLVERLGAGLELRIIRSTTQRDEE